MSFTYNDEGIRTSKTVDNVKHTYQLSGSQILAEEWDNKLLVYLYDASGAPIGMMYRTTSYELDDWDTFFFEKNLQGDIVAIYNSMGQELVNYSYDAWGNQTVKYWNGGGTSPAQYNPFRYRGYYYDTDLRMYYLQSRYYDAKICRFINTDGYVSTGQGVLGNNMFAYCGNNPVNYLDYTGEWFIADDIIQLALVTICTAGILWLVQDALGDQVLGNFVSDVVTQTAEAVNNLVDGIKSFSDSKADENDKTDPTPPMGTVIYRYGGTNPSNLTPKEKDKYSGLSFSTIPLPGAAMTTIEALNATGVVYAVQDGPSHVSVRPVGATMEDWIRAGSGSIWTQAVKSVVVKWGGN